jgi:hypothetical protein
MEIQLYEKMQNPIEAINQIGEMFSSSGMFGCTQPAQGKVLALVCMSERKSPVQILREYHLYEGKLSDRADSMLAKFIAAGGRHKVKSRTPDLASVELTMNGEAMTFTLSWEEIQKEPFVYGKDNSFKKNYRTPRARMQTMWARVISDGVRTLAPNIVAGIQTPEELEDQREGGDGGKIFSEPSKGEAAPKATKSKKEDTKVIEAEVVTAPVATSPTPAPAPVSEPAKAPAQDSSNPELAPAKAPEAQTPAAGEKIRAVQDTNTQRLTKTTVVALQEAIGEANAEKAMKWMVIKKWLKEGGTLFDVTVERAQKVLDNPAGFLNQVSAIK